MLGSAPPSSVIPPNLAGLIDQVRGRPLAMVRLARTLLEGRGLHDSARALCRDALALAPHDAELAAMAALVFSRGIGSWYFSMVQDHGRHALYEAALARHLRPGMTVLDIGAGTGLFAMMAAHAGAARVIACERDPAVAEAATAIVAANGLSDRVTILPIASQDLSPSDLPGPVDLLLWDNLANNLFGAGCVATLRDAHERLIASDTAILPARIEVVAALATDLAAQDRTMTTVAGFDLGAFNRLAPTGHKVRKTDYALLSEGVTLFDFDCAQHRHAPATTRRTVGTQPGTANAIVQWLRFHLADGLVYETRAESASAFGTPLHPIAPFTLTAPAQVTIGGGHDTLETWFWAEPAA